MKDLLKEIGEDVTREGLLDTPKRVAKAMTFAMKGYGKTAREALGTALFQEPTLSRPVNVKKNHNTKEEEDGKEQEQEGEEAAVILVRDVPIFSTSSTSMMPFYGVVHVGYVPKDGFILGLSKVARVAEVFARRMQNPESLVRDIAEAVGEVACASGVGVILETKQLGPNPENDDGTIESSSSLFRNRTRYGVGCLREHSLANMNELEDDDDDEEEKDGDEKCAARWAEFEGLLGMGRAKNNKTTTSSSSSTDDREKSSSSLKAPPKKALEASVRLLKAIGLKSVATADNLILSRSSTSSEHLSDEEDEEGEEEDVAMRDSNSTLADDISLSSYTSFDANANAVKCRSVNEPFSLGRCAFNYASMMCESVRGRDVSLESTVMQNSSNDIVTMPVLGRCFPSITSSRTSECSLNVAAAAELTIERDLVLTTTCEHHLLPFHGVVHVAYWHSPGFALERKLVQAIVSRQGSRLQVQERLTSDLADDFEKVSGGVSPTAGVMICISAAHMCMASRGIEKTGSSTCTVATRGMFTSSLKARTKVFQIL